VLLIVRLLLLKIGKTQIYLHLQQSFSPLPVKIITRVS
jgi:hypothetical protein